MIQIKEGVELLSQLGFYGWSWLPCAHKYSQSKGCLVRLREDEKTVVRVLTLNPKPLNPKPCPLEDEGAIGLLIIEILAGPWVVISGVGSRLNILITHIRGL